MKIKGINCDDVVAGYLTAALWASTVSLPVAEEDLVDGCMDCDEDHPLYGVEDQTPLDDHFGFEDLTEEFVRDAVADCAAFGESLAEVPCEDSDEDNDWTDHTVWEALVEQAGSEEQIGHDFWLTRNGHGAGFWDRGYTGHVDRLACEVSRGYGGIDILVNEDGSLG